MLEKPPPGKREPALVRLPPQRIEAEESLLGSILMDNESLLEIVELLTPEDFYRTAHGKIFDAVIALFENNEPVDLITLSNILRERGDLERVGGAAFLTSLVDTVPQAVNVLHYARIVREKAVLRRLIEKSNSISKLCYQDQGNVDEIIEFAQKCVFEISENKVTPSFSALSDIINHSIDVLEDRQANRSLVTGIPTGFKVIDKMTSGLQRADLIIMAGRPSMGKTAFALNIARNAAIEHGASVAVFSLEMSKEQLAMRLLCSEGRIDSSRLRSGFLTKEDMERVRDAAGVLYEAPIHIDDSPDITSTSIRTKSRRLKMEKGLDLVVIDYIQLMRTRSNAERRDLEISEISRSLKMLAKEIDIPVVALSQLNRKLEERGDKRPMLSDLRESGALEQDADVVSFIYRDEVYNKDENNPNRGKAEIIIAKQRNGPVGYATLAFLNAHTRFEDLAPEYEAS